jgi:hypothetical protein
MTTEPPDRTPPPAGGAVTPPAANADAGPRPYGTDLYDFAGLLGESFRARVGLLGAILGNAHHPSVGSFKESLIADLLRQAIPQRFSVGTGFVLFPVARGTPVAGRLADPMGYHAFILSRQCDVIVYDAANVPVVFRDLNFVVVRPESVRAVVEIKGRLTPNGLVEVIDRAADFGEKWSNWAREHRSGPMSRIPSPRVPMLGALAFETSGDPGRPNPDGTRARRLIAERFGPQFDGGPPKRPMLDHLFVYDEYVVSTTVDFFDNGEEIKAMFGWQTAHGRWLKTGEDGQLVRREDKTMASLLAAVLAQVEDPLLSGVGTGQYVGSPWRARDELVLPHGDAGVEYCGEFETHHSSRPQGAGTAEAPATSTGEESGE